MSFLSKQVWASDRHHTHTSTNNTSNSLADFKTNINCIAYTPTIICITADTPSIIKWLFLCCG